MHCFLQSFERDVKYNFFWITVLFTWPRLNILIFSADFRLKLFWRILLDYSV